MPGKRRARVKRITWPALALLIALIVLGLGYLAIVRARPPAGTPEPRGVTVEATPSAGGTDVTTRKTPTRTNTKTGTPKATGTRKSTPSATHRPSETPKPTGKATPSATKKPSATSKPTGTATPSATPRTTPAAGYGQEVLTAVNRYRATKGISDLAWDDRLATFAQGRAEDMLTRDYFSHNDPKSGELFLNQLGSRLANAEALYQLEGGVSAYLSKIDELAVTDWKNSSAHAAIMGDKRMTRCGIGVAVASRRVVVVLVVEQ